MNTSTNWYRSLLALGAGVATLAVTALTTPSAMATGCPNGEYGPLKISISADKATVAPGDLVTYTICVSNSGPVEIVNFAVGSDLNGDDIDDFYQGFGSILPGQTLCFTEEVPVLITSGCITNLTGTIGGVPFDSCTLASVVVCVQSSGGRCTYTQGYWKTHPGAWPVSSLVLGGKSYTKAQLLTIFGLAPKGDASLILAHQLIAAKLNAANNAQSNPTVDAAIAAGDALLAQCPIKVPCGIKKGTLAAQMVSTATILDAYNNGLLTPAGHCN